VANIPVDPEALKRMRDKLVKESSSRNIGLDLLRVTEAAAIAAGRWIGLGNPDEAHAAATDLMASALNELELDGRIVIGEEGRLGEHSPLDSGQIVGNGKGPQVDVVVDPIDGTKLVVQGHPGAISLVGVAPRGSMWSPPPDAVYMEKIVVDREAADALVPECLDAPAAWTLALVARVKDKDVRDLIVLVLDRPRHRDLIDEIRAAGARISLRTEGDAEGALEAALAGTGADLLMGIGGVSEGVIAACAVRALGGAMLGRLAPQSDEEKAVIESAGVEVKRILTSDEIVASDRIYFAATGITHSPLLGSIRYLGRRVETHSLLLRSETGTRRFIQGEHLLVT
jgi:fructose-1,6-bisphosphatase II